MKNYQFSISLIIPLLLQGCLATSPDYFSLSGGSKADAIIELTRDYRKYEGSNRAESDRQGIALATERCSSWGYRSAYEFGRGQIECYKYLNNDCWKGVIVQKYQCEG